jgi:signal transduction histidine kinase
MKLKWQITLIAVLSLSFPWVVWQAFKSLNQTFQNNMLEAAANQAQLIVNSVQQFNSDRPDELTGLIPSVLTADVRTDGSPNEWTEVPWYEVTAEFKFKLGSHQQQWYLWVEVLDDSLYANPNQTGDRLMVAVGEARGITKLTINRQAEGPVPKPFSQNNYQAYWHETASGYAVEIELMSQQLNRLGLVAINHTSQDTSYATGHQDSDQIQLQAIFKPQPHWQAFLQQITPEDGGIKLQDSQGRTFYQTEKTESTPPDSNWMTELIYELAFDQSQADGSHFFGQRVNQAFNAGEIELTVKHNAAQAALIQTFIRSVLWIFIIALVLLLAYFLFALMLAWRIKRLNKNLQTVLDDQGQIHTALPSNQAQDEIGDLSRGMSGLLHQINDYTDYLKQLGSRLSHEMKTPISIVHTSLENLQMEQPDNEFVVRALNANHRLKFILNQLSALSQLKQVIAETEPEIFDFNQLLNELTQGYRSQAKNISFYGSTAPIMIKGSQELMAQMIDKLLQNALDFTTESDHIKLLLSHENEQYQLKVINTGSQIPTEQRHQLFDSLTSFRQKKDPEPHLGLGLYIAKLICDYHQADIEANNLQAPIAVEFVVTGSLYL